MINFLKKKLWRPIWKFKSQLRGWYQNNFIIPPYSEKRQIIIDYKNRYNSEIFVETGTFLGDTVERMKNEFGTIYSIELSVDLAYQAKERFAKESWINILQGDSGGKISEILPSLTEPTLFWLDGHYSGEFFLGDKFIATAKSDLNTPILKELDAILRNGIGKNVVLIDDARCFDGNLDYPTINELIHFVAQFNIQAQQVTNKRDIIRIVPLTT